MRRIRTLFSLLFLTSSFYLFGQNVNGGYITLPNGDTSAVACLIDTIDQAFDVVLVDNSGENSVWVLTDTDEKILSLPPTPPFDVSVFNEDTILIWHLSFQSIQGLSIGANKNDVTGVFDYSNAIFFTKKTLVPGQITQLYGDTLLACNSDLSTDSLVFQAAGQNGSNNSFFITNALDEIIAIQEGPVFYQKDLKEAICYFRFVTYENQLLNFAVGNGLQELEGCYELSGAIEIRKEIIDGGTIALSNGNSSLTICVGDGMSDAFTPTLEGASGDLSKWVVADENGLMLAVLNFNTFNFEGVDPGVLRVYHIGYQDGLQNLDRMNYLDSLNGCYDLSNPIIVTLVEGDTEGGVLSSNSNMTFCNGDADQDTVELSLSGNVGDRTTFLIMTSEGEILDTFSQDAYDFEGFDPIDTVFLFAISYIDGIGNFEIGSNIDHVEGCFSLSNSLRVVLNNVDGGEITTAEDQDTIVICSDGMTDLNEISINNSIGMITYLIVDSNGVILSVQNTNPINLDTDSRGATYLYAIGYNDLPTGLDVGQSIDDVTGCYGFSNSITILNSNGEVSGGLLTTNDELDRCIKPEISDTLKYSLSDKIGDGSVFILLDASLNVVKISLDTFMVLSDVPRGNYILHHVASQDFVIENIYVGINALDIKGCYDLSNGLSINVKYVDAGNLTVSPINSDTLCIEGASSVPLSFNVQNALGQNQFYIVTDTSGIIYDVFINRSFNVNSNFPTDFLVYGLSFYDVEGVAKDASIRDLTGCFDLTEPLAFKVYFVDGGDLSFEDGSNVLTQCNNETQGSFNVELSGEKGHSVWYSISDQDGNTLTIQDSSEIDFSAFNEDSLYIYAIVSPDTILIDSLWNVSSNSGCLATSDTILFIHQVPMVADLFLSDSTKVSRTCLIENDSITFELTENNLGKGENTYLFVNGVGKIYGSTDASMVNSNWLESDTTYIYQINYFDQFTIDSDSTLESIQGCFTLSDSVVVVLNRADGGQLQFLSGDSLLTVCKNDIQFEVEIEDAKGKSFAYVLTTSDSLIVNVSVHTEDLFINPVDSGRYLIWYVAGADTLPAWSNNAHIDDLNGCFDLSNAVGIYVEESVLDGTTIILDSIDVVCMDSIIRQVYVSAVDTIDLENKWLVLSENGEIVEIHPNGSFEIANPGNYQIVNISYKTEPQNLVNGTLIQFLDGCYTLSNVVEVDAYFNEGGVIAFEDGSNELELCGIGISTDSIYIDLDSPGFINSMWVVTDTNDVVLDTFSTLPIVVDNNGPTYCYIRHLSYYDAASLPQLDVNLSEIEGCYSLSNLVTIKKTLVRGGEVFVNGGKSIDLCIGDQILEEVNIDISNAAGERSAWVLTDTLGRIFSISATPPNNFNNIDEDACLIRHIRYASGTLTGLSIDNNISDVEGCFDFSDSLRINKVTVNGGQLTVMDSLTSLGVCVDDELLENIEPELTNDIGSNQTWLISDGIGRIVAYDVVPPFNFEGEEEGQSFIWNVSFSGTIANTSPGTFLSDMEGCLALSNPIRIRKKTGSDCLVNTENINENGWVEVYPNPVIDELLIANKNTLEGTVFIIDPQGRSIKQTKIEGNTELKLDLTNLHAGLYHIKLVLSSGAGQWTSFLKM